MHDIGQVLGCGGIMKSLIRTRVGGFNISDSLRLDQVEDYLRNENLNEHIIMIDDMFSTYPSVTADSTYNKLIYNGNSFKEEHLLTQQGTSNKELLQLGLINENTLVRVYDSEGSFIGIYNFDCEERRFTVKKMFL